MLEQHQFQPGRCRFHRSGSTVLVFHGLHLYLLLVSPTTPAGSSKNSTSSASNRRCLRRHVDPRDVGRYLLREGHFCFKAFASHLCNVFTRQREPCCLRYSYVTEPEDVIAEVVEVGQLERNALHPEYHLADRCQTVWLLPM